MSDIKTKNKEYMKHYMENNKDKWTKIITCDKCNSKYQICSKSNHLKCKKHKYALLELELKQIKENINYN